MVYVLDQKRNLNGNIETYAEICEIQNLNYPSTVQKGEFFEITYDTINLTNKEQLLFGYMEKNNSKIPESTWQTKVPANMSITSIIPFTEGIQEPLTGEISVGHVEGINIPLIAAGIAAVAVIGIVFIAVKK